MPRLICYIDLLTTKLNLIDTLSIVQELSNFDLIVNEHRIQIYVPIMQLSKILLSLTKQTKTYTETRKPDLVSFYTSSTASGVGWLYVGPHCSLYAVSRPVVSRKLVIRNSFLEARLGDAGDLVIELVFIMIVIYASTLII